MRRHALAVVAGVAALVIGGGCFVGSADEGGDAAEPAPASASPGEQEDGTMTAEEFQQDIGDAVGLAEQYWGAKVRGFRPVQEVIAYEREGEVELRQAAARAQQRRLLLGR